jgi:hypothetical protein
MPRPFDDRSNQRIIRSVLRTEAMRPPPVRVQNLARLTDGSSGSPSCDTIRFSIGDNFSDYTALVTVEAVPQGFTEADVPELNPGTHTLIVHDPLGCFLNEPVGTMLGRVGWAHYMQPLTAGYGEPDEPYAGPVWEIFSLCCAPQGVL